MNTELGVEEALMIANQYGQMDGAHHKMWVIDQMVRSLMGAERYERFVEEVFADGYEWETGIAP